MDHLVVIEKQLGYTKNAILERKEYFQESFENPLFEGEQTAAEVYIHGLTPLYRSCTKLLDPDINESAINLEFNKKLAVHDQYIDLYEQILVILREIENKMSRAVLKEHIMYPFNPETTISRLDWIGLNIMHAVTHVGQALRLQSLYIRHKLEKKE